MKKLNLFIVFLNLILFCLGTSSNPQTTNPNLDVTFHSDGIAQFAQGWCYSTAIQPDGKILAGGWKRNTLGDNRFAVYRYNTDGTLDPGFGSGGLATITITGSNGYNDIIHSIAIQPDGKIVAGGTTADAAGDNAFTVARFNSDGTVDSTFGASGSVRIFVSAGIVRVPAGSGPLPHLDECYSIAIQSDGKIVAGGRTRTLKNTENYYYQFERDAFALMRFNSDGSADNTFDTDGIVIKTILDPVAYPDKDIDDECLSLAIQPDGKIVAGGFSMLDKAGAWTQVALARFNPGGSIDNTFGTNGTVRTTVGGTMATNISSIALQPDGKIVGGGSYSMPDYSGGLAVMRFNQNGTIDNTFGTGASGLARYAGQCICNSLAIEPDGKIVAGGTISSRDTYGEMIGSFLIVKFNSDGTPDNIFGRGSAISQRIKTAGSTHECYSVRIQSDGKIIAAGQAYNDIGMIRVLNNVQATNLSLSVISANQIRLNWTNGGGAKRIVLAKQGSPVDATPVDGNAYTANSTFGAGSQIGTGNFVVANTTSNTITVKGLSASTTYYFSVFENNDTPAPAYLSPGLTGNATTSSAKSLSFDGIDDYVAVTNDAGLAPSNLTVEFWVYPKSNPPSGTSNYFLVKGNPSTGISYFVEQYPDIWALRIYTGATATASFTVPLNTWTYIAFTYDQTYLKVYKNGILVQSVPASGSIIPFDGSGFFIGKKFVESGYASRVFDGYCDELRIWNIARSQAQIQASYSQLTGSESGLICYFPFNEGTGSASTDLTADEKTASLVNGVSWIAPNPDPVRVPVLSSSDSDNLITFSSVPLGSSKCQSFTITNTGGGILHITNAASNNSAFALSPRTADLTMGSSQTFNVIFVSSTTAQKNGTISVIYNSDASPYNLSVSGTGAVQARSYAGSSVLFDGTDDYISTGLDAQPAALSTTTWEAWIKPTRLNYANFQAILSTDNGGWDRGIWIVNNTNQFVIGYGTGGWMPPVTINQDTWYHIAIVYTPTNVLFYLNGTEYSLGQLPAGQETDEKLSIGASPPYQYFRGEIDEVRIWNTARTLQQIREGMHHGADISSGSLVACWTFNEESSNTAIDSKLNYNGTLINGPLRITSTIPLDKGTSYSTSAFRSGSRDIGNVRFLLTENFDSDVDLTISELSSTPNTNLPDGILLKGGRYFIVNCFGASGTFAANLTFTLGSGILDSRADMFPGGVKLYRRNSNSDGAWTLVGSAISANSSTGVVTFNNITSFSQFSIGEDEAGLPVELVSFSAVNGKNNVTLKWKTATEVNNYGFELERKNTEERKQNTEFRIQNKISGNKNTENRIQNTEWETVGFIEGAGNSNSPRDYSFIDQSALYGEYTYRLKQIDYDGKFKYCPEIKIKAGTLPVVFKIVNFPDPFNPETMVRIEIPEASKINVSVYNIIGQRVATLFDGLLEAGVYQSSFSGCGLSSGMYILTLTTDKDVSLVKKILMVK